MGWVSTDLERMHGWRNESVSTDFHELRQDFNPPNLGERVPMKKFAGTWNIIEMDEWDADYLNMETQAYIKVGRKGYGEFQFGLVHASINGEIEAFGGEKRFSFTFEGNDEGELLSGDGWLKVADENSLQGFIRFHSGDSSLLKAERRK